MNYLSVNLRGVGDSRKVEWVRGLKTTHGAHFVAIQETKVAGNINFMVSRFWGKTILEFDEVEAMGRSGGILAIWDPTVLSRSGVVKHRHYLVISGQLRMTGEVLNIASIYAPNDPVARRHVWAELLQLRNSLPGMWILLGDFNDVRGPEERCNSEFVSLNASFFNQFIENADLLEYQMGGRQFTYRSDNGAKLSKLDRFLVSRDFMNNWPLASVVALSNFVSDHNPILLSTVQTDYGKIPSRMFNSWLEIPGASEYVDQLLESFSFSGPADLALDVKLKWVKRRLKEWVKNKRAGLEDGYNRRLKKLEELEVFS
ncbi:uncharacterized protein LOC110892828 [Helianthus annuus]|uniref:uncharacterized protein LOC110892828 n=1 Tax=Helianthus annuus TaxID=4232 RepID=UPI000B9092C8|nr:uncharacterized protein LOC110892828 [Helianthus annuus]